MLSITNHQGNENQNTVKYHLTAVSMANIKKIINNTFRSGEKFRFTHQKLQDVVYMGWEWERDGRK